MSALLCCGQREKLGDLRAEQKWDYINLDEFKSDGCGTPFSYGVLYFFLLISIAVYAIDIFTAINLLAFDRWSGQIKPALPFTISRWIFAGCILLSLALLFYRWLRAVRVMKQGGIAQSYLDPLAVRVQSIRMGKEGRGWKRFLVFAALTKSKKGADYVALFTYFSFEAWLRILFAEGPRQVINAITLYSVLQLKLIPTGDHAAKKGHSPVAQFFTNIEALADSNIEQAAILFGMLFTLVIWVISVINLSIAVLFYVFFLWHHIPSADGGLGAYCRRKINSRMEKIVQIKVAKALKKENALRARQEAKDGSSLKSQPTLPDLAGDDTKSSDMPLLSRTTTEATLPLYSSPSTTSVPTLPNMSERPFGPSRSVTQASYSSNAPLMGEAGAMGYGGRAESPRPPSSESYDGRPMAPGRTYTGSTQASQRSYPDPRTPMPSGRQTPTGYPGPGAAPLPRTASGMSAQSQDSYQMGPLSRPGTAFSTGQPPSMGSSMTGPSPADARGPFPNFQGTPYVNRGAPSPAPSRRGPPGPVQGYTPYNPGMRPSTPQGQQFNGSMRPNTPQSGPQFGGSMRPYTPQGGPMARGPPPRSNTQPIAPPGSYGQTRPQYPRAGTAPPPQGAASSGGYDDILNAY